MKYITTQEMFDLIERYNKKNNSIPKERFMCQEGKAWVNMDNTDTQCYVEAFPSKELCFMRCLGYLDADGVPYDDKELCKEFMKLVDHIISFEGDAAADVFESMGLSRELADY